MQKVESLGQLTGGVAHDFNNLLMAVLGNLDLLRKIVPDNPKACRLIDGAIQGAERGATLTKRMLAFARRQELKPEPVDVPALVDSMVDGLVAQSGGAMRISSVPGTGTTVELWLPVCDVESAAVRPGSIETPRIDPIRSCRVIVVDDDPIVAAGTAAMLEGLGHVAT